MRVFITVLMVVNITAIIYVLFVGYDGLIKLAKSLFGMGEFSETLHNAPRKRQMSVESAMPISIILPDCDNDPNIIGTIKELLALEYPEFEVIMVCDSLKSNASESIANAFSMAKIHQPIKKSVPMGEVRAVYRSSQYMNLTLLGKESVGRYDAMNAGVNISHYPLFVILDTGRRLEKDALAQIALSFARNFSVVAVGSLPRIRERKNKPLGFIGSLQEAEYLRTFPAGLAIVDKRRLAVIPGAFGAFRKETVIKENGFIPGGSETEMVVRLTRGNRKRQEQYEVEMLPTSVLVSEPPKGIKQLVRQRIKWESETFFSLWANKRMFFNPGYGRAGMLDTPYYWLFTIIGPFIELIGCIVVPLSFAFGIIGIDLFMAFLAVELLLNTVVSLSAVVSQEILDSDVSSTERTFRRTICAILNNFGYRQLLLLFSIFGIFKREKPHKIK